MAGFTRYNPALHSRVLLEQWLRRFGSCGYGSRTLADGLWLSLFYGWIIQYGNLLLALVAAVVGCLSVSLSNLGPRFLEDEFSYKQKALKQSTGCIKHFPI